MYVPTQFAMRELPHLLELIRSAPLGTLIVDAGHGFEANHLPFLHRAADSEYGVLCAHLPRANPVTGILAAGVRCLVIFGGPNGYISPSWYATKYEHGRVVPTWNYAVVHAHGRARLIDDEAWILGQLQDLTDANEANRSEPWSVSDAPEEFIAQQLRQLLGLEVTIDRLEGKLKASQNQPQRNQTSVLQALAEEQPGSGLDALMRSILA